MTKKIKFLTGFLVLITFSFVIVGYVHNDKNEALPQKKDQLEGKKPKPKIKKEELKYGFSTSTYDFKDHEIKRNENLSDILLNINIPYQKIHQIALKSKDVFDVKQMRAGNKCCLLTSKDSSEKFFVYEKDPVNYVVFDLNDSVKIYQAKKKVKTKIRKVSGVITSSLYETLQEKDISPLLAIELSEVYAWAIDFYRIQKNDKFKVIYEEKYVDGKFAGLGKIISSVFNHYGNDFYAFYFKQNDKGDYFDEDANSLRKQFLKAPLKYTRISSHYTLRRFHPVQKRFKAHLGTDYAAPTGTPIRSVGDGVVTHATYGRFNGNYVKIRHNSVYTTQYLHMSKIKSGIRPGVKVKQGEVIGFVGSTGLATGPHLCFRFWKNGKQVDPFKQKIPPAKPVDKENLDAFYATMKNYKDSLDAIHYNNEQILAEGKTGNPLHNIR